MTPNFLAWAALAAWPGVVLLVFAARRASARPARTTAWMMLFGVMFLPSALALKTQGVPALDKYRLTVLSVALALQIFHRRELLRRAPGHQFSRVMLLVLVVGVWQTVRTNGDVLVFGPRVVPGLTTYDIASISAGVFLDIYLPFAIGQRVFRSEQDLRDLLEVLCLCGLIYLPFCLVELRLSPQVHRWVYGYHQHRFIQTIRAEGFRPNVFMAHGLGLAMFLFTAVCAGAALLRARARLRPVSARTAAAATELILVACRSVAAAAYSFVAAPLLLWASPRTMRRVAAVLVALVLAYPVARTMDAIPTRDVVAWADRIAGGRAAQSLEFRFTNEDELLGRALQRLAFGWGSFGRNRIYSADEGKDISTTDGEWILRLGCFGYVGFLGYFALFVIPVVRCARARARAVGPFDALLSCLALLVGVSAFDMLPNAPFDNLSFLYAGALFTLSGPGVAIAAADARRRRMARARRATRRAVSDLPVRVPSAS